MIPLIVAGAVSLASNVVDAWKAHADTTAATKAAKTADFQQALKIASTQSATASAQLAAASAQQQQQALPANIQSVTGQILQSPDIQSMARANPSATVNLQFNANGDLFATQTSGAMRRIAVTPDLRQQLQQLNSALRSPAAASYSGAAHVSAQITSRQLPVQVNLAAV
jgi:hypothetical protein